MGASSPRWNFRYGQLLSDDCQLRAGKDLNNMVEQDHRFIKRRVNPGLGFFSFRTARRTIKVYEAMNIIRKGQITGVNKIIHVPR
jgi:IS6 family transposase